MIPIISQIPINCIGLFDPFLARSKRKEERNNQIQDDTQVYHTRTVIVISKLAYRCWKH